MGALPERSASQPIEVVHLSVYFHDSGLCATDLATRRRFANDPLNLTLASPAVNRCGPRGKCAYDAAAWMPKRNRCWFAARIVEVRRKYELTIDRREAMAIENVLAQCKSTDLVFHSHNSRPAPTSSRGQADDALRRWDDNRDRKITCAEARRHGIAPVRRGHPAYPYMFDRDRDGTVCE